MTTDLDEASARWLVSNAGRDSVAEATRLLDEGSDELSVAGQLGRGGLEVRHVAATLSAALARRRARDRWPDADDLLFTRTSLEQASDPAVARWRAGRYSGEDTWDLCAGTGGDALEIAVRARALTAVEVDPARAVLLQHNAAVRDLAVEVIVGDALEVAIPTGSLLHADPGRRSGERRVRWLRDHLPPVRDLLDRHRSVAGSGVVLSPALDLADPDLPSEVELEFIQLGDRLVEAIVWGGTLRAGDATATATLLPSGDQRSRTGPRPQRQSVGPIGTHLVEVAAAAVRARLHDDLAGEVGARRLASHRALFSTAEPPPASPWYRARRIITTLPARPKAIRSWLRTADPGPIEIVLHGVDGDPERWWREIGRPSRGPSGVRVELVRLDRGARAIVTSAR